MVRPMDAAALDFAVAAWREEGTWRAEALPARDGTTIDGLTRSLQALPAESGAIALVSVADDFFLILRVDGTGSRLLLSDAATAHDWPLAAEALDELGLELPDDEDVEEFEPAGDLGLLADLGLPAAELSLLCQDGDKYPDEVLAAVAKQLHFGDQFDALFEN